MGDEIVPIGSNGFIGYPVPIGQDSPCFLIAVQLPQSMRDVKGAKQQNRKPNRFITRRYLSR